MKRIGILSSGGDTPGMNAAIRSCVKVAHHLDMDTFGIEHGFRGMIEGWIRELDHREVDDIIYKGGTILKTSRCKEFMTEAGQQKAVEMAQAYELEGVIVIGGDGSMKGAAELSNRGVRTICLPGTIDNDLAYTDFTIGFDTAVSGVVEEIYKVKDTMESHDRIGVVEVMGNKCGDIALHAGLAGGCDFILTPEHKIDLEAIKKQLVKNDMRNHKSSMIVVAEGAAKGEEIAQYLRQNTQLEVKSVVLGYTQRGGNPTARDRILASRLAQRAVELLHEGVTDRTVGIRKEEVVDMDIQQALAMPMEFDEKLYELCSILAHY